MTKHRSLWAALILTVAGAALITACAHRVMAIGGRDATVNIEQTGTVVPSVSIGPASNAASAAATERTS